MAYIDRLSSVGVAAQHSEPLEGGDQELTLISVLGREPVLGQLFEKGREIDLIVAADQLDEQEQEVLVELEERCLPALPDQAAAPALGQLVNDIAREVAQPRAASGGHGGAERE